MPTYAYHCSSCKNVLDVMQKITEEPLKICPECGKDTLMRGPGGGIGLQFQGSGFYITDYKNAGSQTCNAGQGQCCPCAGKGQGTKAT